MIPAINPAYLDAQLLERAIEGIAKLTQDNAALIAKMQAGGEFPAEMHAAAQQIKVGCEDAMSKLVALRLAVI